MSEVVQMVHVGGQVPSDLAKALTDLANKNERSASAELRLALKAHVEAANRRKAS